MARDYVSLDSELSSYVNKVRQSAEWVLRRIYRKLEPEGTSYKLPDKSDDEILTFLGRLPTRDLKFIRACGAIMLSYADRALAAKDPKAARRLSITSSDGTTLETWVGAPRGQKH